MLGERLAASGGGADGLARGPEGSRLAPAWTERAWDHAAELADGPRAVAPAEAQLARLAASVGPLRRLLAAIAARLTGRRAFERLGFARLSDYARERAGISARQLQELARVHHAFAELPALERALVENVLPWSKVRLIARVATRADEAAWLARARAVSTRRLEQEVREWRAGSGEPDDPEEEGDRRRVGVRCAPAVCDKWSLVREVAQRVAGERLRDGEVLEFVAAEAFSALSIDPAFVAGVERRGQEDAGEPGCESAPAARARARPLHPAVSGLARGLDEADAYELDRRLRHAVRLEQTLDAAMAPLLRRVRGRERAWRCEYRPLSAYARDELGMSGRKARGLLRLERAGDLCPQLRDAYRRGRISWVKAQCLVPLVLLDAPGSWRTAWVVWASRVTVRRLWDDVQRALLLQAGHPEAWLRCRSHPERTRDAIPSGGRQLCARGADGHPTSESTHELVWRVPDDVAVLFVAVRETWRAKMGPASDGQVFESLLDHALRTWTQREPGMPRPDPVIERDGYRCAVPGCTSRRNLHDHHIAFRSAGGSDAPENRITLCAFHHLRGVHAGQLEIHGRAPDALVFELGVRRGKPPLVRYRSGDVEL